MNTELKYRRMAYERDADQLNTARGIAIGVVVGAGLWTAGLAATWALLTYGMDAVRWGGVTATVVGIAAAGGYTVGHFKTGGRR